MFATIAFAASFAQDDDVKKKTLSSAERKEIAERICASAREAVSENDLARTEITPAAGFTPFEEVSRSGWVLIGLRLGTTQVADRTIIQTVEPIYLTPRGEVNGVKRGKERNLAGRKSKAFVTETLRAKPGYAVGALKMEVNASLDGLALVFMRIAEDRLDPKDNYESKWVGNLGQDRPASIGGAGHLIVGVRGVESKNEFQQLGVVFAGKDAPAKAIAPKAGPGKKGGSADDIFKKPGASMKPSGLIESPQRGSPKPPSARKPAGALAKEPKTPEIDLTLRQPSWKWEERYRHARVGDFVQYELTEERFSRHQEIVEVGDRFIVFRERIMPIKNQKLVTLRFDEGIGDPPTRPTPEIITVEIGGRRLSCKRYVLEPEGPSKSQSQEVYCDDVPFDGLVGRLTEKGSVHLRKFGRGPE